MSKIILESESIVNFMGCKSLKVDFNEDITLIYADNGVGKTRLEDAFNWCLFGKNSSGNTDFPIKDTRNSDMHVADHEVTLVLKRNGFTETLKRILRETKNKNGEFVGNETVCYWNDVKLKVGEFNSRVDSMLREQVFKMITNVNYFNDDRLTTKTKRRDILVSLVGGFLSDEDVAADNKDYKNLLNRLADENKSLVDLEKQVKQQISRINDDMSKVQPAIAEIIRNMPNEENWEEVEANIKSKKGRIADIDGILQNKSTAIDAVNSSKQKKQLERHSILSKINDIKFIVEQDVKKVVKNSASQKTILESEVAEKEKVLSSLKGPINENAKIQEKEQNVKSKKLTLEGIENNIVALNTKKSALTTRWVAENEKQMPEITKKCFSCDQDLPQINLEEQKITITENWNKHLLNVKAEIEAEGKLLNTNIQQEQDLIETIKKAITTAEAELQKSKDDLAISITDAENYVSEAKKALENYVEPEAIDSNALVLSHLSKNNEYLELNKSIALLDEELTEKEVVDDSKEDENSEIKEEKKTLQGEVDSLNKLLGKKEVIEQNKKRIDEHNSNAKLWANELTSLMGSKNVIRDFNRAKIDSLEERINSKFLYTKFNMYKELVNGELEDDCEAVYDGRPYSALNTADKINCGLDIINTLSTHYDISAPIFIDNRESIVKLIPVNSQTIQMFVSGEDKEMRIV